MNIYRLKYLLILLIFNIKLYLISQDSLKWEEKYTFSLLTSSIWTIDHFGNLYLANKDQLKKFDSNGKQLFAQSLKKYGDITMIDARNPMKILLFSEQQQTLFYMDNTLTKQNNDIDLADFDMNYVTKVSSSKQADKIWLFDQQNSKINLITSNKAQSFIIENTAGILNFTKISQLFEANNSLWIVDPEKGIYQFDIYGTLVSYIPENEIIWLEVDENYLYLLKNDTITILGYNFDSKKELILPITGVKKFKINEKDIFLESKQTIHKFHLEIF